MPADSRRAEVLADFVAQASAVTKTSAPTQPDKLFSAENPKANAGEQI